MVRDKYAHMITSHRMKVLHSGTLVLPCIVTCQHIIQIKHVIFQAITFCGQAGMHICASRTATVNDVTGHNFNMINCIPRIAGS